MNIRRYLENIIAKQLKKRMANYHKVEQFYCQTFLRERLNELC